MIDTEYILTQTVAPATEPLTTAEAKAHLRVDADDDDDLIDALIVAARQYAETFTNRQFITATWKLNLPQFPICRIELPNPPLIAVSSITYLASTDGTRTTLASSCYQVVSDPQGGWVQPAYNETWPDCRVVPDSVAVTYTAGYGATAASVPQAIRQAMLMLVAHWYENREATVVGTISGPTHFAVESLLYQHRAWGAF